MIRFGNCGSGATGFSMGTSIGQVDGVGGLIAAGRTIGTTVALARGSWVLTFSRRADPFSGPLPPDGNGVNDAYFSVSVFDENGLVAEMGWPCQDSAPPIWDYVGSTLHALTFGYLDVSSIACGDTFTAMGNCWSALTGPCDDPTAPDHKFTIKITYLSDDSTGHPAYSVGISGAVTPFFGPP